MNTGGGPAAAARRGPPLTVLRPWLVGTVIVAFYAVCWRLAEIDPGRLATGLPRLVHWMAQAWPPDVAELPLFVTRIGQTIAMAALGTTFATLLALPVALFASRNITPIPALYTPTRMILNVLRSIDSVALDAAGGALAKPGLGGSDALGMVATELHEIISPAGL